MTRAPRLGAGAGAVTLAAALLTALLVVTPVTATDPLALGKELYVERCVLCHGSQGHGWEWTQKVMRPPVTVPDLVETVPTRDDRFLKAVILDGGEAVGQSRLMPAFRFRMSDDEADAVVRYLRSVAGAKRSGS